MEQPIRTRTSTGQVDADGKNMYKRRQSISAKQKVQYKPTENNLCVVILRAKQLAKKN